MTKTASITYAQAEVIRDLLSLSYGPHSLIDPSEIYPKRDNQDNGKRRTLARFARLGMADHPTGNTSIRLLPPMFKAYREWYDAKGWKLEEFKATPPMHD